ncbi:Rieske (2Fe-2S) protein [Planctomicrobium sp. SH664]|uniref:Rieske (2Fe-2S) protein n=1 Tax=Planctomicrobium sp. SH664 TaxID=3448125 RepID=UPI003F5C056D
MWHRLASVDQIPEGTSREFTVGDQIVAVFHTGDDWYALDGICPHAGGPLGEGTLCGTIVTCPWHGWQFDVSTGRHCLSHQIRQRTFAVRVEEGHLCVELP